MTRGLERLDASAVARRLRQIRLALGYPSQSAMARKLGIRQHQYNVVEKGRRRIALGVAMKAWEKAGVSLDWIYCGDPSGLPPAVRRKLKRKK